MNRRGAFLVAVAIAALPLAARAETPIGGITIGASIAATVRELGAPQSVESSDAGNIFTFPTSQAFVDDEGVVRAAAVSSGAPSVLIDGKATAFAIGTYTSAQADAHLASIQEFSSDTLRSYALSPRRELALIFATPTHRLVRVYYGERGPLARLGILPGDDINKTVPFRAPKLRGTAVAGTTGALVTIVKLDLDVHGNVTTSTIVVPSTDVAADAELLKKLSTDRYIAAQLGGRAIGSVVFREIRH